MIKVNGKPIEVTIFPDNTSQVWKVPEDILKAGNFVNITWEFSHEGEFMHLAQLKDLLDTYHVDCSLAIPYLPYARQDKPVSNSTTFSLNTFARLLNSLNFNSVELVDVHSKVALFLIKNSKDVFAINSCRSSTRDVFNSLVRGDDEGRYPTVCFPDAGAADRYVKSWFPGCLIGEKTRNQLTGEITGYKLSGDPSGKDVLIVDDICDYGNTFIKLTQLLKEQGAASVSLYVTHGVFSGGLRPLKDSGIEKIYTKDGEISVRQGSSNV